MATRSGLTQIFPEDTYEKLFPVFSNHIHKAQYFSTNLFEVIGPLAPNGRNGNHKIEEYIPLLLKNDIIRSMVGGPQKKIVFPKQFTLYDKWLLHLWSRRLIFYLGMLSRGLNKVDKYYYTTLNRNILDFLEDFVEMLKFGFATKLEHTKSMRDSLKEREDIVNYHITYLDPILFSSLYHLYNYKGKWESKDVKLLYNLIKSEVLKYTLNGTDRSDLIADESTLWWGISELLKKDGEVITLDDNKFSLSENYEHKKLDITDICIKLMCEDDPKSPDPKNTFAEATPEIYNEVRTRLLIIKNCFTIWDHLSELSRSRIYDKITKYLRHNINRLILHYQVREIDHIYTCGLFLDTFAPFIQPFADKGNSSPTFDNPTDGGGLTDDSRQNVVDQRGSILQEEISNLERRLSSIENILKLNQIDPAKLEVIASVVADNNKALKELQALPLADIESNIQTLKDWLRPFYQKQSFNIEFEPSDAKTLRAIFQFLLATLKKLGVNTVTSQLPGS